MEAFIAPAAFRGPLPVGEGLAIVAVVCLALPLAGAIAAWLIIGDLSTRGRR